MTAPAAGPLADVGAWGVAVATAWVDGWNKALDEARPAISRARWSMEAMVRQMQANPNRRPARTGHRHRGTRAWMRRYYHR
jgi:hypothetical protein